MGRILPLQDLVLEVGFEGDDCWSGKLGVGTGRQGLVAEMERRL